MVNNHDKETLQLLKRLLDDNLKYIAATIKDKTANQKSFDAINYAIFIINRLILDE